MSEESKRPTHRLVLVSERVVEKGNTTTTKAVYTEIAGLWPTKSGGYSGEVPAGMTIAGRFLIQPITDKAAAGDVDAAY